MSAVVPYICFMLMMLLFMVWMTILVVSRMLFMVRMPRVFAIVVVPVLSCKHFV